MESYVICIWIVEIDKIEHVVIGSGVSEDDCRDAVVSQLSPGDVIAEVIMRDPDHVMYEPNTSLIIT